MQHGDEARRGAREPRCGPWCWWAAWTGAVFAVSAATGVRASRAAGAPQYLFTKTRVVVERPYVPENDVELALEAARIEAGEPPTRIPGLEPMFVLGLVDAALPLAGLGAAVALLARRCGVARERRRALESPR